MADLVMREAHVVLSKRVVLQSVSLRVQAGECVLLIGANGAGKTTLLRAALGAAALTAGSVSLDGQDPARMSPMQRARKAAYLPQARPLAWPLKVRDVVALGRFAYGAGVARETAQDAAAIEQALARCALSDLAQRRSDELSGGELARVHIARALAAQAPLLLADEPIAALDPRHALSVLGVIRSFCDQGGAALVTIHDVALAARFATRVIVLADGHIIADGAPDAVITPALMQRAFGVLAEGVGAAIRVTAPC